MFFNIFKLLSYLNYTTTLMESPYVTDCRDYTQSNFETREHCFEDCMNRKTRLVYSKYWDMSVIENYKDVKSMSIWSSVSNINSSKQIRKF